jgi:hypothetical protein
MVHKMEINLLNGRKNPFIQFLLETWGVVEFFCLCFLLLLLILFKVKKVLEPELIVETDEVLEPQVFSYNGQ